MSESPAQRSPLDRLLADRPDLALMLPYFAYLALLATKDLAGEQWVWAFTILRTAGAAVVIWLVRKHLPPWGKPHLPLAIGAAAAAAVLWVGGQHFFDSLGVPRRLPIPLFPGAPPTPAEIDPFSKLGGGVLVWTTIVTRIFCAVTVVAVVEELFWRAFLLRALIDWHHFERVPLGAWSLRAFLVTALLSCAQHPDNWLVSVFCWFLFNGLMYWKKSVCFLVCVHGLTNLFLYVYVVWRGDWIFW